MTDYKQAIDEILQQLCNTVYQHGKATKTNTPFHYGEPMKEAKQALTHLINKAREKDLQKYLDQMREIMAENFHYRTICGDIKDPSGKQDINELFIKYQELEPEREKFANYVEDRIKELEGKE